MDITTTVQGDVTRVDLKGNFDIAASSQFDQEITTLIDGGSRSILLDFTGVPFVASTGLRMILKAAQTMKAKSGQLRICCVNETVMEVFQMTGFDTILSIFESVDSAMEGLA